MDTDVVRGRRAWTDRVPGGIAVVAVTLGLLWFLEIVDTVVGHRLDGLGIHPHDAGWLAGILFAPFLHAGFEHLINNSVVFAVLGVVAYAAVTLARFVGLVVITTLTSGFGAWAFGAPGSVVIGASGVIFGLLGFLLVRGIVERSVGSIVVSVLVLIAYGGTLLGLLPGQPYISWQGHLFGFLGGVLAAFLLRVRKARRTAPPGGGYLAA